MSFLSSLFGKSSSSESASFRTLVTQSMEELQLKTAAHDGTWHLGEADWSVDQDNGMICFTTSNGLIATAPVQIVGTYNTDDSTWLWGWDHPSVAPALQAHARQIHSYGQTHRIARLTTRKFTCTEAEAWELTALTCKLCDAQGAYRGPADAVLIFMTFGEVALRSIKS